MSSRRHVLGGVAPRAFEIVRADGADTGLAERVGERVEIEAYLDHVCLDFYELLIPVQSGHVPSQARLIPANRNLFFAFHPSHGQRPPRSGQSEESGRNTTTCGTAQ